MDCIFVNSAVLAVKAGSFLQNMRYFGARRDLPEGRITEDFKSSAEDVVGIFASMDDVLDAAFRGSMVQALNTRYEHFANNSRHLYYRHGAEAKTEKECWQEWRVRFAHTTINSAQNDMQIANRILDKFLTDSAQYYQLSKQVGVVPDESVKRAIELGRKWIPGHDVNVVPLITPGFRKT